jgi:hypothetical protein
MSIRKTYEGDKNTEMKVELHGLKLKKIEGQNYGKNILQVQHY